MSTSALSTDKFMSLIQTVKFIGTISGLVRVQRQAPKALARLQRKRLERLVAWATRHSPFYRERYRHVDLRSFTLAQLPPVTKEELMSNFDRVVTDPCVRQADVEEHLSDDDNLGRWFLNRYAVSHTSGSQGQPMLIVQDREALTVYYAMMCTRANPAGTPGILQGIARLTRPVRIAVVTMHRGFYPSGAAIEFMPELVGHFVRVERLSSGQPDLVARLNEYQPNVLVSYASTLETLALREGDLHLRSLRQVANISEQLTERARSRVEAAFGVPLTDNYAVGECLLLSHGCQRNSGAHINSDWVIVEVVDAEGRPVEPGQLGAKLLVTNLANRVQPFIRYEVPDRAAISVEPCRCGSPFPRIANLEGRAADIFWIEDGTAWRFLSGVLFHSAADSLGYVREWRAIQTQRNLIEILLELLPGNEQPANLIKAALYQRLSATGLPKSVDIRVQVVPELHADSSTGKFRRMISRVGPPSGVNA